MHDAINYGSGTVFMCSAGPNFGADTGCILIHGQVVLTMVDFSVARNDAELRESHNVYA